VFQNSVGSPPEAQDAVDYAEALGDPDYPVVADPSEQVFSATGYDGSTLPGKCVLSPEMVMLECTSGHGNEDLFEAIVEHASSN
jgi:hypothetical protein